MPRALAHGCLLHVASLLAATSCADPPAPSDAGTDAGGCVELTTGECVSDDADDDDDGTADGEDCAPLDPDRQVELVTGACVSDDADDDDDGTADGEDCAPRDPMRSVTLADGACADDDADDDGDGVPDDDDCAPTDPSAGVELTDGRCAPNDEDDDDDGALDDDDCAPLDPGRSVTLATGACVQDDADDDDDGVLDTDDCAPLDAARQVELTTGACVPDDADDDDDGAFDTDDCAPLDPGSSVALANGACVPDDADDDDDGVLDTDDCAPLDPGLSVTLSTGACVPDDADDDGDGAFDTDDCAPADPTRSVTLSTGACVPDDADDDDDGVLDIDDCAPLDAARQVRLASSACVADDADDDDDGVLDGDDCSARDARWQAGPCAPGDTERQACGSDVGACVSGERTRTCRDSCHFGAWSACGGGAYVAPSAERCDAPGDEDCDGSSDEGCGCDPVAPGAGASFAAPGEIRNLRVDPVRCLAYATDVSTDALADSAFVVFDTQLKTEVTRIPYGHGVADYDVSPDGARIAIARHDVGRIDILEPPVWTPSASYAVGGEPHSVEIGTMGFAYYSKGSELFVLDLSTGASTRVPWVASSPTLELSPDETTLYAGAFNSQSPLYRFDVGPDGTPTYVERTEHLSLGGFARPQLTVSPDGALVAWAGQLIDAFDLRFLRGQVGWHLDAFDASGRFMAAGGGIADVARVRGGATHWASETAVLVSADQEVWWHDDATGRMHYANVADFVDLTQLGRREWPPLPLADYDFTSIVVDPVRPWLYAVDGPRGEVVVFDRGTLTPLTAIEVGVVATDAAIDPSGSHLYTGHHFTWGVAAVNLDELTYAGLARTHLRPTDIAVVRTDRVVSVGEANAQRPSLIAPSTGVILDHDRWAFGYFEPALAPAGDGSTLYVGESGLSTSCLYVLDTSGDVLTEVRSVDCLDTPPWGIAAVDGTPDVFWARARRNTATGAVAFTVPETIRTVTPDGRLAISESAIYDATTGAFRASLPSAAAAQALSPDGRTLYLGLPGAIRVVSLVPYLP